MRDSNSSRMSLDNEAIVSSDSGEGGLEEEEEEEEEREGEEEGKGKGEGEGEGEGEGVVEEWNGMSRW